MECPIRSFSGPGSAPELNQAFSMSRSMRPRRSSTWPTRAAICSTSSCRSFAPGAATWRNTGGSAQSARYTPSRNASFLPGPRGVAACTSLSVTQDNDQMTRHGSESSHRKRLGSHRGPARAQCLAVATLDQPAFERIGHTTPPTAATQVRTRRATGRDFTGKRARAIS